MLCYLTGMKPFYIKLINDGSYVPTTAQGLVKPEAQSTQDDRRVVNQDQRLKSITICNTPKNGSQRKIMSLGCYSIDITTLSTRERFYKTKLITFINEIIEFTKAKLLQNIFF
jgi:anaerobic ribonucleoside-triphosphate reductase